MRKQALSITGFKETCTTGSWDVKNKELWRLFGDIVLKGLLVWARFCPAGGTVWYNYGRGRGSIQKEVDWGWGGELQALWAIFTPCSVSTSWMQIQGSQPSCLCCLSCPSFLLIYLMCHDGLFLPKMASQNKPFPSKVALVKYFYHTCKKVTKVWRKSHITRNYENIPKQLSRCSNVSHSLTINSSQMVIKCYGPRCFHAST